MSQAEKIREIVVDLLKENTKFTEIILVNEKKVRGIKYTDLKNFFIVRYPDFSEGAIIGALQTLPKRIDNIFKTKTKNGVYFFYSEDRKDDLELDRKKVAITDSEDYMDLEVKVEELSNTVGGILRNAGRGKYLTAENLDISYLRDILDASENLQTVLKNYKREDAFKKIEHQSSKNPFSINKEDDLPF